MRLPSRSIPFLLIDVFRSAGEQVYTLAFVLTMVASFTFGFDLNVQLIASVTIALVVVAITTFYFVYRVQFADGVITHRSGLFSVKRSIVHRNKIDKLSVNQDVQDRILGLYRVDVYTLGGNEPAITLLYMTKAQIQSVFPDQEITEVDASKSIKAPLWRELGGFLRIPLSFKLAGVYATFVVMFLSFGSGTYEQYAESANDYRHASEASGIGFVLRSANAIGIIDALPLIVILTASALPIILLLVWLSKFLYFIPHYCNCSYKIEGGKLRIRTGYLFKKNVEMDVDNIKLAYLYWSSITPNDVSLKFISYKDSEEGLITSINEQSAYALMDEVGITHKTVGEPIKPKRLPSVLVSLKWVIQVLSIPVVMGLIDNNVSAWILNGGGFYWLALIGVFVFIYKLSQQCLVNITATVVVKHTRTPF